MMQKLFQFASYLEIHSMLVFPALFPIHYCISKLELRKLLLISFWVHSGGYCAVWFGLLQNSGDACTPVACIEGGEILPCRGICRQACMNTVYPVKVFRFFSSSCAASVESGMTADWKLHVCTGQGNPEACVCVNLVFDVDWAKSRAGFQPPFFFFLILNRWLKAC